MRQERREGIKQWGKQRGLNTEVYMDVDAQGLPVRVFVTFEITVDCLQALALIEGFAAEYLLTNRIINEATRSSITVVILPKNNHKEQREYDKEIYRVRHLVENAFLHLKGWCCIATGYAKNVSSFVSSVHIRCISIFLSVLSKDICKDVS